MFSTNYFDEAITDAALDLDDTENSDKLINELLDLEMFCRDELLPILAWKTSVINGWYNLTN